MQGTVKFKLTSRHLVRVPRFVLRRVVAAEAKQMASTIAFMSPNHHAVRNFVVTEIATTGAGVSPERIADKCGLAPERVAVILDELERKMVFVWRDEGRDVSWAYPVTSEATPHRIEYVDAKPTYGAWGIDALATPFVQGRLQHRRLAGAIHTSCACCGEPMCIEFDGDLNCHIQQDTTPVISTPMVNIKKLAAPNIIEDFWRRSLFFWSEEHARKYPLPVRAVYWDLAAATYLTPRVQGALFGLGSIP